ncbi:MAG: hypothetical protein U0575_14995 [Phycisphaerales bacterium]
MLALLVSTVVLVAAEVGPPPPGVASTNAADGYMKAIELLQGAPLGKVTIESRGLLEAAERIAIADVVSPQDVTPEVRAALGKAATILELVREAAALGTSDYHLERSKGFDVLLPHLSPMRDLARLLKADAAMHIADGDGDGAVVALSAVTGLAQHTGNDNILISSLVGSAISGVGDSTLQMALDAGLVDAARAETMAKSLERLQGSDPFHYASAVDGERELFDATAQRLLDSTGDANALAQIALGGNAAPELASMSREEMLDQLAGADRLYAQAADAFRNPDPDAAKAALADIERQAQELGPLTKALMPAYSRVYEAKLRSEAMVTARVAQLRDLASGRISPASLANAATWYLAAARAAAALHPEDQRLIEVCRVVDGDLDPMVRDDVARSLQKRRSAVIEPLLLGAEAGRCAFPRSAGSPPVVALPSYAAGLRAATRVLLADALLMGRAAEALGATDVGATAGAAGSAAAGTSAAASVPPSAAPPNSLTNAPAGSQAGSHGGSAADSPPDGPLASPAATRDAQRRAEAIDGSLARLRAAVRVADHVSSDASLANAILAQSILDETRQAIAAATRMKWWNDAAAEAIRPAVDRLNRIDPLGHRRGLAADRERLTAVLPLGQDRTVHEEQRKAVSRLDADAIFAVAIAIARAQHDNAAKTTAAGASPTPAEAVGAFDCGGRDDDVLLDLSDLYVQDACAALAEQAKAIAELASFQPADAEALRRSEALLRTAMPKVVEAVRLSTEAPAIVSALDALLKRP